MDAAVLQTKLKVTVQAASRFVISIVLEVDFFALPVCLCNIIFFPESDEVKDRIGIGTVFLVTEFRK